MTLNHVAEISELIGLFEQTPSASTAQEPPALPPSVPTGDAGARPAMSHDYVYVPAEERVTKLPLGNGEANEIIKPVLPDAEISSDADEIIPVADPKAKKRKAPRESTKAADDAVDASTPKKKKKKHRRPPEASPSSDNNYSLLDPPKKVVTPKGRQERNTGEEVKGEKGGIPRSYNTAINGTKSFTYQV